MSPGPGRRTAPGGRPPGGPLLAVVLAVGLLAAMAPQEAPPRRAVAPDSARLDSLTAEVASKLRCPVCRNQSVLESTATLARQMQSVIRERLAAGDSPEEIQAYFVDKYGEWILLRPEAEGIGLLVYVLPALALLAGGILVALALGRWSRASPGGEPASAPEDGLEGLDPEERRWIRRQVESA